MSKISTIKELNNNGIKPEILFWVGCAGSFDDQAKKVTKSFTNLLDKANVSYAVLGTEESCTGVLLSVLGMSFCFKCKQFQIFKP